MILKNGNSCPSPVIKHNLYYIHEWLAIGAEILTLSF